MIRRLLERVERLLVEGDTAWMADLPPHTIFCDCRKCYLTPTGYMRKLNKEFKNHE